MTEQLWCCAHAGQRLGPVPFARLRQMAAAGAIARTDLVWPDGRPEEATPASTFPGLFPTATPAPVPLAPPPVPHANDGAEPPARAAARVWDAAGGVLQLVVPIVAGILLLAMFVGMFCGKTPQTPPAVKSNAKPLPVEVGFRASAVGKGMVLRVKNVSDRPLSDLMVSVTAARGEKAGKVTRGMTRPLEPGQEVEIGWAELDGWQLAPGETVQLGVSEPGYDLLTVTVPAKAAGR